MNGSNMATSWKLPLAAAAGEAAEPPPPPPAGPASPPGPATSAAGAPPLGRPGVFAARREVPAAEAAGTCSLRVGGPGRAVPGGPGAGACRPAACPREARAESGWECQGPRARKPVPWGRRVGYCVCPRGLRHQAASTTSEPANALETPARMSMGGGLRPVGSRRGRLSLVCRCPGPHLMLGSVLRRDRGGTRASGQAAFLRKGPAFGSLRNECAGCAVQGRDLCKRKAELDNQGIRLQGTITPPAPRAWGNVLMESGRCAKRATAPNAGTFSLLISLPRTCIQLRKLTLLLKPKLSGGSGPFH